MIRVGCILAGILTITILGVLLIPFVNHAVEWYWDKVETWLRG